MKLKNIALIPQIVNKQTQKLVNTISDHDLVLKMAAEGLKAKPTKVKPLLLPKVTICKPDDKFQNGLQAISMNQPGCVVLIDPVNKALGVISQADEVIHVNQTEKSDKMVKHVSKPTEKRTKLLLPCSFVNIVKWLLLFLLFVLSLVASIIQEQMALALIQNLKVL